MGKGKCLGDIQNILDAGHIFFIIYSFKSDALLSCYYQ